ncbi:MAG: glycosyltransferase, partial [Burkholderiaceae bacterium]
FTGWVSDQQALDLMSGSRGFIQASKEDFGIAVVEAQACGIPVLAYAEGGARETVSTAPERKTGMLFDGLTPEALAQAVELFEQQSFRAEDCRQWAQRFSVENFDRGFREGLGQFGMPLAEFTSARESPVAAPTLAKAVQSHG